eukprot:2532944-Prymnesium_polylepis.2
MPLASARSRRAGWRSPTRRSRGSRGAPRAPEPTREKARSLPRSGSWEGAACVGGCGWRREARDGEGGALHVCGAQSIATGRRQGRAARSAGRPAAAIGPATRRRASLQRCS